MKALLEVCGGLLIGWWVFLSLVVGYSLYDFFKHWDDEE